MKSTSVITVASNVNFSLGSGRMAVNFISCCNVHHPAGGTVYRMIRKKGQCTDTTSNCTWSRRNFTWLPQNMCSFSRRSIRVEPNITVGVSITEGVSITVGVSIMRVAWLWCTAKAFREATLLRSRHNSFTALFSARCQDERDTGVMYSIVMHDDSSHHTFPTLYCCVVYRYWAMI